MLLPKFEIGFFFFVFYVEIEFTKLRAHHDDFVDLGIFMIF